MPTQQEDLLRKKHAGDVQMLLKKGPEGKNEVDPSRGLFVNMHVTAAYRYEGKKRSRLITAVDQNKANLIHMKMIQNN